LKVGERDFYYFHTGDYLSMSSFRAISGSLSTTPRQWCKLMKFKFSHFCEFFN
jgi:hypothetical protein